MLYCLHIWQTQQYQSTKEPFALHLLPHSSPLWSLVTAHLYFPSVVPSFLEYHINAASLRWSLHLAWCRSCPHCKQVIHSNCSMLDLWMDGLISVYLVLKWRASSSFPVLENHEGSHYNHLYIGQFQSTWVWTRD